jgi:hypothetical protein
LGKKRHLDARKDTAMKKALITLALLLLVPSVALAVPTIVFDTVNPNVPGGAGGTLTYGGGVVPLFGADIQFTEVTGIGTPLTPPPADCVGCFLNFETGVNTLQGPSQWTWAGGGTFTLTGTVPDAGILAPVDLLTGTFTGTANTPGLAAAGTNALFISIGVDTKHPDLLAFYGLGPGDFIFANTEIALGTFTLLSPVTGAFTAVPNQADIINLAQVPLPPTGLLVGLGLLLMGSAASLRRFV